MKVTCRYNTIHCTNGGDSEDAHNEQNKGPRRTRRSQQNSGLTNNNKSPQRQTNKLTTRSQSTTGHDTATEQEAADALLS